ncbi:MAG TPA: lytic transglycosylase domain-containing protein [Firmicutes bacterium]|nr:lytic transglycosylase domain-containing protein [Bacillota bacterium]
MNRRLAKIVLLGACCFLLWYLAYESRWFARRLCPIRYQREISRYSFEHDVDPFLLLAMINVESKFSRFAESPKGARGLMQIMPETGAWVAEVIGLGEFSPDMLYEPHVNIRIGSWYLASLQREFGGDLTLALAAYNAGRGTVHQWLSGGVWSGGEEHIDRIPFPETRKYVRRVLRSYRMYKWAYRDRWVGEYNYQARF